MKKIPTPPLPNELIITNSRIANVLRKDCRYPRYNKNDHTLMNSLCTVHIGSNPDVYTKFVIQPYDDPAHTGHHPSDRTEDQLTYFDMMVADAIYTLYLAEFKEFTPNQVLKVMAGDPKLLLGSDRKEVLLHSIDKLCHTFIDIFCPEETKKISRLKPRYSGPFLCAKKTKANGKNSISYIFEPEFPPMPLYEYGDAKQQRINLSFDFLKLPEGMSSRTNYMILAHYLLREMMIVQNKKNSQQEWFIYPYNKTKDKTYQIFSILGIDPATITASQKEQKAKEILDIMSTLLLHWNQMSEDSTIKGPRTDSPLYGVGFSIDQENSCIHLYQKVGSQN